MLFFSLVWFLFACFVVLFGGFVACSMFLSFVMLGVCLVSPIDHSVGSF